MYCIYTKQLNSYRLRQSKRLRLPTQPNPQIQRITPNLFRPTALQIRHSATGQRHRNSYRTIIINATYGEPSDLGNACASSIYQGDVGIVDGSFESICVDSVEIVLFCCDEGPFY